MFPDINRRTSSHKLEYNEIPETSNALYKEPSKSRTDLETYIRDYQTAFETHFVNRNTMIRNVKPIPDHYSQAPPQKINDTLKSRLDNFLETPLEEFRKFYQSQKPQRPLRIHDAQKDPPDNPHDNSEGDNIKKDIDQCEPNIDAQITKNQAKYEFEILKRNLNKIYNLQDEPSEIPQNSVVENVPLGKTDTSIPESDKNLLRIEVEHVNEIKQIVTESEPQNVLLVVETSVDENEVQSEENDDKLISANMTIIISPKRSYHDTDEVRANSPEKGRRSVSPEQAARLTRNDVLDAIFHTDTMKEASSIEMQLEISKEKADSISEADKPADDYPDDFSADVDNYNSRSEYENQSPISLPKDDPFWDT